jgi:predicted dehydrogenase
MTYLNTTRRDALVGIGAAASLAACDPAERAKAAAAGPKLGVALVGLGWHAEEHLVPALRATQRCRLTALVSSDEAKRAQWGRKYDVPAANLYGYDDFERIAANGAIDIMYIMVPNGLHARFAIQAAQAGKHVLCEKPMAVSVEQCESMIDASRRAGRQLGVAYRCQFSRHHIEMVRLARERVFGHPRLITAKIGYPLPAQAREAGDWRLKRSLAGGGVLLEQGIYAVQAARYLSGEEPVEVAGFEASIDRVTFAEVEDTILWKMRFPSGLLASCAASYSAPMNQLWVGAEDGHFELAPAFDAQSVDGRTSRGALSAPSVNQFAAQLDHFARCIQESRPNALSGEEGLRDARVIEAIYRSVAEGRAVQLST